MAIKMNSIKCPECGASLPIEEGRTQIFCSYCGANVRITNENEYIFRTVDEADIKQAETERIIRLKELELEQNQQLQKNQIRKVLLYIWLGLLFASIILCLFIWIRDVDGIGGIAAFDCFGFVVCPIALGGAFLIFKVLPEKDYEKKLLKSGEGLMFPAIGNDLSEMNYDTLERTLRAAGFMNVESVSLHDVKLGLFTKNGAVESVTINGSRLLGYRKVYPADSLIIIKYHGK